MISQSGEQQICLPEMEAWLTVTDEQKLGASLPYSYRQAMKKKQRRAAVCSQRLLESVSHPGHFRS
jgi:hypothetical protein